MSSNDDESVGGAQAGGEDAGDALSPPERHAKLGRNRFMVAVVAVTVVAVVVFFVAAAVG